MLRGSLSAAGIRHACHPLDITADPEAGARDVALAVLARAEAFVRASLEGTGALLVHCRQGRDRTGLALAWLLRRCFGLPLQDAIAQVLAAQPEALTASGWMDLAAGVLTATTPAPINAPSLFVYGSLQPGGPNEHVLADVEDGHWEAATVAGTLVEAGWGAALGYPGLRPQRDGPLVRGQLFRAPSLAEHFDALDAFEGDAYRRAVLRARTASGAAVHAHCYVLR